MITQDQIRELRELHAKGTGGEWGHDLNGFVAPIEEDGREWGKTIVRYPGNRPTKQALTDCSLIAAIHNAAPDLLDAAEEAIRLRELVKVMQEALEQVILRLPHKHACARTRPTSEWAQHGSMSFENCSCEIKSAKEALALASKEVAS